MLITRQILLALALLGGLIGGLPAKSQRPPNTDQTNRAQQPPSEDQRGTEKSPAIVKILPPGDAEAKTKQEADDRAAKNQLDTNTIRLGIAAILVAFLQFVAIGIQAIFLWRTVKVSEDAAKAATRSSEAVVSQLRAYVVLSSARIQDFGITLPPKVLIVIKNTGQTPAIDMLSWAGLVISPFPLDIELRPPGPELKISRSTLGPGIESAHLMQAERSLTQNEIDLINSGKLAIYVFGEITYKDVFKNERITRYCMMYGGGGGTSPDGALVVCEDGNEAT